MDLLSRGVQHLKDWLKEESDRPEMIGEVRRSDIPCCPECGLPMRLIHSRRTDQWAVKHEVMSGCGERFATGIWRSKEREAIADWQEGYTRYCPANTEQAVKLIEEKLKILDAQLKK